MFCELCSRERPRRTAATPRRRSAGNPCARPPVALVTLVTTALGLTLAVGAFAVTAATAAPASSASRSPAPPRTPAANAANPSNPANPATPADTTLAEPWDGRLFTAAPAEVLAAAKAAAATIKKGESDPVAMLFFEAIYSFDGAGRLSRTTRMVYRIESANADPSWSEVAAGWLPWHQRRPRMRARVVTPDGQEHRLDPNVLEQSTAGEGDPEMYADRQVLRGPLPATGQGAVIEEEETVEDSAPAFDGGVLERQRLGMNLPVRHTRVVLEAPVDLPLRYVVEPLQALPPLAPRRESVGGRQRIVFELRDLPANPPPPPGLPPEAPRQPAVAFSSGASWRDIAERYSAIVDRAAAAGGATGAGAPVADWLRASGAYDSAGSQLEAIDRVLAHMTAIRYTGVELGEGSFVPRPPAETLGRRFGDCKDKAVLLVAALRALDIPAYVALLAAGDDVRDADPALPGFGAFDHAIVYVPGTPAIWIDPTDPYARAGELPSGDQGRSALIAAPGVAALTRTIVSTADENRVRKTREFFLADNGAARVVETIEYGGAAERQQRAHYATIEAEALKKETADYAERVFLGKSVLSFEHSDARDLSQPLRRRLEVREARRGYTGQANAVVAILYSALFDLLPDDLTDSDTDAGAAAKKGKTPARRTDYYFDLPHSVEVRYRIVLPAGFEPEDLPASRVRQLGTASLSESYTAAGGSGGVTTAVLRLDSGKQRIAPAELAALRSALAELVKEQVLVLRFRQVGEAAAAAGHIREALAEFRQESTAAPGKALPHLRMARALLAGGLGEAARRETDVGVKLEPRSAGAYDTLGWVLQHDAVGRRFGQGFSREQALAAYTRALQLDPAMNLTRADYAILLEHDARGHRYMAGADLKTAIAQYRTLRKDYEDDDFDDNLLVDLLYAGQAGEALTLAATMKASDNKPAVTAAATALAKGADAAVHEVESTIDEPSRRWPVLQSAAQTLLRLRAYAAAAALLERAGPMSPDASKMLAQAAVLRKARPLDQIPLPAGEPSTVARRALIYVASEGSEPEKFYGLFSEHLATAAGVKPEGDDHGQRGEHSQRDDRSQRDDHSQRDNHSQRGDRSQRDERSQVIEQLGKVQKQVRKQISETTGLPADLAMELGFASVKETVTGDDQLGFRIDYSSVFGGEGEEFFVVREPAGFRIAAVGNAPAMLGMEALRRLDAGDLAGARQWLDWARELTKEPDGDLRLPPFSALWTRGAAADAERTRCAAAALAADEFEEEALPVLRRCRAAARTEEEQVTFDAALAASAFKERRWDELRELAERLGAARPRAEEPFVMAAAALRHLGRTAALADLARHRLELLPADRKAALILARAAEEKGDLDEAERRLRTLAGVTTAGAEELNELAWLLLVRGRVDDQTVELAQRATRQPDGKSHGVLHTLGAILAESGRPAEAYQVMVQAINAEDEAVPDSADWYVFGRMAEQYGLPEVARGLYARVEKPAVAPEISTYHLAQARLAAIKQP